MNIIYKNRLKNLREEPVNFIRRREIANLIGIHVSAYSQYEGEGLIIPLKYLNIIANHFDVSID